MNKEHIEKIIEDLINLSTGFNDLNVNIIKSDFADKILALSRPTADLDELRDEIWDLLSDFKEGNLSKTETIDYILPHLQKPCINKDLFNRLLGWVSDDFVKGLFIHEYNLQKPVESDAVKFADYLESNWYFIRRDSKRFGWINIIDNEVLVHGSESHYNKLLENHGKTTTEVYQIFKNK